MYKSMPEAPKKPFWKRTFWFLIKLYATLCTLVTTILIIGFTSASTQSTHESEKDYLQSEYEIYMSTEFPKRSVYFQGVGAALNGYAAKHSAVSAKDVLHYLGEPDHVYGDSNRAIYTYLIQQDYLTTNQWYYIANFSNGKFLDGGVGCYTTPFQKSPRPKPH